MDQPSPTSPPAPPVAGPATATSGADARTRRLPPGPGKAAMLAMAAGVTITVVAWGVLVFTAIDFGRSAREGTSRDWLWLALSTLGAVVCMFAAIVLAARLQQLLRSGQQSSTRPLPRALQEPYEAYEAYGNDAELPSAGAAGPPPAPRSTAGKRALRH